MVRDAVEKRREDVIVRRGVHMLLVLPVVSFGISFLAILFHELGHFLAASWCRCQILEFHLSVSGGHVTYQGATTPEQALLITVAGPAFSLALGCVGLLAFKLSSRPWVRAISFLTALECLVMSNFQYLYGDMFLHQRHDYYRIYQANPQVAGVLIVVSLAATFLTMNEGMKALKSAIPAMKEAARPPEEPREAQAVQEEHVLDLEEVDARLRELREMEALFLPEPP